jgi:hypothetical protein
VVLVSTAIDTRSDVDVIEHLDFDPELACEATKPPCGRPAEWILRCRFCGASALYCTQCRMHAERLAALPSAVSGCKHCLRTRRDLADLVMWIPVRGGA